MSERTIGQSTTSLHLPVDACRPYSSLRACDFRVSAVVDVVFTLTGKVMKLDRVAIMSTYHFSRDDWPSRSSAGMMLAWWNMYLSLMLAK